MPLTNEPMQYDFSFRDRWQSLFATVSFTAAPVVGKHMCPIIVNYMQTLVCLTQGAWLLWPMATVIASVDRLEWHWVLWLIWLELYPSSYIMQELWGTSLNFRNYGTIQTLSESEGKSKSLACSGDLVLEDSSQEPKIFAFFVLAGELEEAEQVLEPMRGDSPLCGHEG